MNAQAAVLGHSYEEAEKLYREYLETNGQDASVWTLLGEVLLKEQKFYDAADAYSTALDFDKENPQYMYNLGTVLAQLHEYEEARALFEQAAKLSDNIRYQFKVGDMLGYLGKYDEALVLYTLLMSRYPLDPGLYRRVAIVYAALGRVGDAAKALAKELELRQRIVIEAPSASALYKFADTKARLHLWDEAEEAFRTSLEMEESADTHMRLGAVLAELGQTDEAKKEFARAADMDPRDFLFLMKQADVLTKLGMFEDSITYYTRALELRSVHADAWAGIAYALLRMKKTDEAKAFFEMAKASAAVRELPWADKLHKNAKTDALDAELP